jgi:hypothetical protein
MEPLATANSTPLEAALALMTGFAERTGLTSDRPPRRYLWTDAFAVCNFLALARSTGDDRHLELARRLVDQVHQTLGRHRADDRRRGWLSGLGEAEGATHPTSGGLRIGKPLPERRPDEPADDELEWDRDGQYFHYLTRWMHALDQLARCTCEPRYTRWARELAEVAHAAFRHETLAGGPPRLFWKMSIDLKRPLVLSMGQHDALDGLVTCTQLRRSAVELEPRPEEPMLDEALSGFAAMLGTDLVTPDPLGIGGLLADACWLAQLLDRDAPAGSELIDELLDAAAVGLAHYTRRGEWRAPAARRLGFRELGLSIGLHAVERLPHGRGGLERLEPFLPLAHIIETHWLHPAHRDGPTWSSHRDINDVMLATSLVPDGYLTLWPTG